MNTLQSRAKTPSPEATVRREKSTLRRWLEEGKDHIVQQIHRESTFLSSMPTQQVPTIAPEGLTPNLFKEYHRAHTPVIIKGLMKDTQAVETWTLPWFQAHYGNKELYIIKMKEGSQRKYATVTDSLIKATLGEAIDMMLNGERIYLFGYSNLFIEHPHLVERDIDLRLLSTYCNPAYAGRGGGKVCDPFTLQLFLGGADSGSSFHCESGSNMFVMITGTKKWTLVPPSFTPYMYPQFHQNAIYCDSPIDLTKSTDELIEQGHELWQYVPKYEAYLEPGDVLFNPAWWWHWVQNTSPTSIAIADRFVPDHLLAGNTALNMMLMTSPHALKVFTKWLLWNKRATDRDLLELLLPREDRPSHPH